MLTTRKDLRYDGYVKELGCDWTHPAGALLTEKGPTCLATPRTPPECLSPVNQTQHRHADLQLEFNMLLLLVSPHQQGFGQQAAMA